MKRLLRIVGLVIVALALVAAIAWWWLTATTSGARWVLGQAQSRVETLDWADADGGLMTGLTLNDVRFEQAGLAVTADRLELEVAIGLLPLRATVERLHLADVEVQLPPPADDAPAGEPFRPGDYRAPLPVTVDSLVIDGLSIESTPDQPPTRIERIELAGRYGQQLTVDELSVSMAPYDLTMNGSLGLAEPWRSDLEAAVDWRVEEDLTQRFELGLAGPLRDLEVSLDAQGPLTADAQGAVRGLPDASALSGRVSVSGSLSGWPGVAGSVEDVRLSAEGAPADWQAELDGRVDWPGQPVVELSLTASGSTDRIRVTRGAFELLDGVVRLTGQADMADMANPATADATVGLEGLDFTALYPDWPAQAAVSGGFDAAWDGRHLRVTSLALRAPPAELTVDGEATLDADERALDVALSWESLAWPPVTDDSEPLFASESGRLEASGTLAEWRAEIEAWLTAPGQPRARIELDAEGDAEQARILTGRVDLADAGGAALTGRVGWTDGPSAALTLALDAFDPGAFVAELTGKVDGRVGVSLSSVAPLTMAVDIERLDGTLRSQPLAGSGALRVADNRVDQADLALSLGDNRAGITTRDGARWQLDVDADTLSQLWPGLAGSFEATSTVDPAGQSAEWTLTSDGMGFGGRRLARLESGGQASWGEAPDIDATLEAVDVDLKPWERLESVRVALSGNCRAHTLTAGFSGTRAGLDFELTGHLPGCLGVDRGWSGVVRRMQFTDTPLGDWQLDQNLPLQVRDGVVRASAACLWTPSAPGRLCLNELRAGAEGEAQVAFNSVPVDLLLLPADPVFRLGNRLRGIASFGWDSQGVRDLSAELRMDAGAARLLGAQEDLIVIRGASLSVASPTPRSLDATLALRLESNSEFTARAEVPDLATPDDLRLDATADLRLPNLGVLNRLVPQLDEMGGSLRGEFALRGQLEALDFDGRLAISDGRFFHAPLGSRIEDLDLVFEGDESGGDIDGRFSAGDGRAEIGGFFDLDAPGGWQGGFEIDGENLRLFNVDWLAMTTTPELALSFGPEQVEIDGRLRIDRARLGLPPGSEQRVAASPDVVVSGRDRADDEEDSAPARDIVGDFRLELGDDVRFSAAELETRIAGALDLAWTGPPMPSAEGTLRLVDGSYSAYGQNLEVTEGDVVFTGKPIDNPVLGIEAVRTIFGDPVVEQAGVRIDGPAQDPEIELFTRPPTSREKALAYIVTGAEFDHAAGQGAFSVGFWVLPKLFVSYGLGLFETGNVLAARYDLSDNWGIRATSGERDTGVDVSFIIDD